MATPLGRAEGQRPCVGKPGEPEGRAAAELLHRYGTTTRGVRGNANFLPTGSITLIWQV
jgi:hypothetical protein